MRAFKYDKYVVLERVRKRALYDFEAQSGSTFVQGLAVARRIKSVKCVLTGIEDIAASLFGPHLVGCANVVTGMRRAKSSCGPTLRIETGL